jgi:hypothetical protein
LIGIGLRQANRAKHCEAREKYQDLFHFLHPW